MTMEASVLQQDHHLCYNLPRIAELQEWSNGDHNSTFCEESLNGSSSNHQNSSQNCSSGDHVLPPAAETGRWKRRRRSTPVKEEEERENQRRTHIAMERNRRKMMNHYLAVLRSLMPPSYAHRGDQASIVGGAINYVRELEQQLRYLQAHMWTNQHHRHHHHNRCLPTSSIFSDFFTFPQYSSTTTNASTVAAEVEVEVKVVESHASVKVVAERHPKQLLKMVAGLVSLRLSILHLSLVSVESFVFYSFSLKVEEDCQLNSVDEIATTVYEMMGRIQKQAIFD